MMRQQDLSHTLAECLQKLEAGYTVDQVLAQYPSQADQLKSLLQLALTIKPPDKGFRIPASAQVDSRRLFLNQASKLQQRRGQATFWAVLRFFQHNLVSGVFALTAIVILFIALASAGSLPGDSLYPIKLTAEGIGASVAGNSNDALGREANSDQRRLSEVTQMIESGRTGTVHFAGYLDFNASGWTLSDIPLVLNETLKETASGLLGGYIEVKGTVNERGLVEVTQIQPRLITLTGSVQTMDTNQWLIDQFTVRFSQMTEIIGEPQLASQVTVQAVRTRDATQMLAVKVTITGVAAQPTGTPTPTHTPEMTLEPTLTPSPTVTQTPGDSIAPIPTTEDDDDGEDNSSSDDGSSEDDEVKEEDEKDDNVREKGDGDEEKPSETEEPKDDD